ncbi:MAG: ATP phosphoribosyltransferase regulatory subunit [Candidatus Nomurabacteria bacterium]|nr:ATP phosphoribosyltransferase regulatory subunit [Candidatus Nomurabacteria bacterium]USN87657.1 MAG: ATP phosphoribosyltransferase regulatory subunit [Candidatus Nomurabacteria bacterium]
MKYSPTEFLKVATNTAEHFGFRTADSFKNNPLCKNCNTSLSHNISDDERYSDASNGLLTNSIATFCEKNLYALDAPVLLYSLDQPFNSEDTTVSFNIFNVPKSIAEAILIQTSRSLMQELGHGDATVRINSLGDNESITRYNRELTNFLKKRLDVMPATARELMKVHPFKSLVQLIEEDHELAYKSPKPLEFLSDQSRKHFREIIEYLDMTETPYEIDPMMLSDHEYYSDALFAIGDVENADNESQKLSVHGGRYDEFVFRKLKNRIPAVGTIITLKSPTKTPSRLPKSKKTSPDVYVVQLGFGPKVRSLMIIDELRRAGIPVQHDLSSDSLSTQLREAEARGVKYSIIIGQKEFIEQTVILRNMQDRNQENISTDQMIRKLKRQLVTS